MNPAGKTVQELTQSLHQSEEIIQQLTEILSKSEKRSQWLERTFRWLAILFICLTMTVFYVGFDWVNKAQATAEKAIQPTTTVTVTTQTTATTNQEKPNPKDEFKYQRQSCQQGMQLMMVKQAQDLLVTSLTLNKDIQQLPANNPMTPMMTSMNDYLNEKLGSSFPKDKKEMKEAFDKMFADNSRIACDTFVQLMNITRKLEQFKADWNIVRKLLLKTFSKTEKDEENKPESDRKNRQDPLYPVAKIILNYLYQENAIKKDRETPVEGKEYIVDSALASYLASGVMKGIASLNILGEIQRALKAVPDMDINMEYMNANMRDMNAHMYYMMRNMGVMTGDMDSTLGRAGRNMPWMPW
jgi:hypothetical protein